MGKKNSGVDLQKASAMWNRGASVTEIGAAFGVTRNTISGLTNRNRNLFPSRREAPSGEAMGEWIKRVDIEEAARLWAEDWQLSSIGHRYGITRGQADVMVRGRRDLFPKRERGRKVTRVKPLTAKQRIEHAEAARLLFNEQAATRNKISGYDVKRLEVAKPLHELAGNECKWPIGEDRPFVFCAAQTKSGDVWCSHHRFRAFQKRAA